MKTIFKKLQIKIFYCYYFRYKQIFSLFSLYSLLPNNLTVIALGISDDFPILITIYDSH